MSSRPLMISLLDKDDTELLELVSHTFKEGLKNNVAMPGVPSLRSKMLNLIEVSLTCYNNHKEHEQHYQEQQREAHRQFQSRIASPVINRNDVHNSGSGSLPASSSSTSSKQQKWNRNVTRNRDDNNATTTTTARRSSSSMESMNRNASDSSNGTTDVTTIAPPVPPLPPLAPPRRPSQTRHLLLAPRRHHPIHRQLARRSRPAPAPNCWRCW